MSMNLVLSAHWVPYMVPGTNGAITYYIDEVSLLGKGVMKFSASCGQYLSILLDRRRLVPSF